MTITETIIRPTKTYSSECEVAGYVASRSIPAAYAQWCTSHEAFCATPEQIEETLLEFFQAGELWMFTLEEMKDGSDYLAPLTQEGLDQFRSEIGKTRCKYCGCKSCDGGSDGCGGLQL